jgi:DNA-binding transcriptional regulator LsrR (DeoR family)
MTNLYTEDQLQEVTSWMEDEGRSVTIATVSQSLGISRLPAQALLEQLGKENTVRVTVTAAETKIRESSIPTTGT